MNRRYVLIALLLGAALTLAACPGPTPVTPTPPITEPAVTAAPTAAEEPTGVAPAAPTPATGATLTVMTHDSFSVSEGVVEEFQSRCGCAVQFLKSGDTGQALSKAMLSKDNPLADVFFGVDNTFLGRALAAGIFEPYASPALSGIPADLQLDPTNRLLPVDYGYVTINYDREFFADNGIPLPATLRDLTSDAYAGMLVAQNPASSSPGLAFLAATVMAFGETGDYTYLDFWTDLRANDVLITEGWEDAYYGQFSGGSGEGDRPMVISYATSPAAEVFFADPQPDESPTGSLPLPGSAFEQVEFVGILAGAKQPALAQQWIDFMLGDSFQADIPLQMWVYPAKTGTPLPEVFTRFAQEPAEPATMTPAQLQEGRERWIQAWTDAVLR